MQQHFIKPGCSITINVTGIYIIDRDTVFNWLSRYSGMSPEYVDKIIGVFIKNNEITVKFDDSANCFEAMQQIRRDEILIDTKCYEIRCVRCPHGRFVFETFLFQIDSVVDPLETALRDVEELASDADAVIVLKTEREFVKRVCTGDVEVVLFVHGDDTKLRDWESSREREKKLWVQNFYPGSSGCRIDAERVKELWMKYGPDANKAAAAEETKEDEAKDEAGGDKTQAANNIEQVD